MSQNPYRFFYSNDRTSGSPATRSGIGPDRGLPRLPHECDCLSDRWLTRLRASRLPEPQNETRPYQANPESLAQALFEPRKDLSPEHHIQNLFDDLQLLSTSERRRFEAQVVAELGKVAGRQELHSALRGLQAIELLAATCECRWVGSIMTKVVVSELHPLIRRMAVVSLHGIYTTEDVSLTPTTALLACGAPIASLSEREFGASQRLLNAYYTEQDLTKPSGTPQHLPYLNTRYVQLSSDSFSVCDRFTLRPEAFVFAPQPPERTEGTLSREQLRQLVESAPRPRCSNSEKLSWLIDLHHHLILPLVAKEGHSLEGKLEEQTRNAWCSLFPTVPIELVESLTTNLEQARVEGVVRLYETEVDTGNRLRAALEDWCKTRNPYLNTLAKHSPELSRLMQQIAREKDPGRRLSLVRAASAYGDDLLKNDNALSRT